VGLFVCLFVKFNAMTREPLDINRHESFTGSMHGQTLGCVKKWLRSDVLLLAGDDLTSSPWERSKT